MGDPHVDLRNNWTALVAHAFLWMFRTVSVTNGLSDTSTRPRPGVAPGNPRPPAGRPDARPHRSTPREVGRVNQVKNTVGGPHARARTRHTSPYTAPSLSAKPPRALRAVRPASGHIGAKISLVTACQQRAISKNPTPLRHWFCHPPPTLAANEGRVYFSHTMCRVT